MSLQLLAVEHLRPSPANVRENLGDLTELAASIKARGMLQPLVVGESRNGVYTVIDGHRRLAAAKLAHITQVPCLTSRAETRSQVVSTMLAAALHKGLEPLEQANAFDALRNQGMSVADIARSTGYSTATVKARMMLLTLPPDAQRMVAAKQIGLRDAVDLAKQVRAKRSGSTRVRSGSRSVHFSMQHRLAGHAGDVCDHGDSRTLVGSVACGQCWEATIRADERGEVEHAHKVDEMAIQRAIDGDAAAALTPTERAIAVERLNAQGLSDGQIAERLNCTGRTVLRARQRRGIQAAVDFGGNRVGGAA